MDMTSAISSSNWRISAPLSALRDVAGPEAQRGIQAHMRRGTRAIAGEQLIGHATRAVLRTLFFSQRNIYIDAILM
jgi:hypothetical protein